MYHKKGLLAVFVLMACTLTMKAEDISGGAESVSADALVITNVVTNIITNYRDGRIVREDPLTIYHPSYIAFGLQKDQVKVQLSFQYDILHYLKIRGLLYGAYSQLMFWDLYTLSGPFRDFTFNPEVFLRYESGYNPFGNVRTFLLDVVQLGFDHRSNGKDGTNSRSIDRLYAFLQLAVGSVFQVGINARYSYYFRIEDNPDVRLFMGSFEFVAFVRIKIDRTEILNIDGRFSFGDSVSFGLTTERYWAEVTAKVISPLPGVGFFGQGWVGYGESLIDYNKYSWSIRIGVVARS